MRVEAEVSQARQKLEFFCFTGNLVFRNDVFILILESLTQQQSNVWYYNTMFLCYKTKAYLWITMARICLVRMEMGD